MLMQASLEFYGFTDLGSQFRPLSVTPELRDTTAVVTDTTRPFPGPRVAPLCSRHPVSDAVQCIRLLPNRLDISLIHNGSNYTDGKDGKARTGESIPMQACTLYWEKTINILQTCQVSRNFRQRWCMIPGSPGSMLHNLTKCRDSGM